MKRIFTTLLALIVIATAVSASENVDPRILSAFEKEFSFAKNVKWEKKGDYMQASFSLNDQRLIAWYNSNAELRVIARNILYMQLPLSVIKSFQQNYAEAELTSVVEFTRGAETFYQLQITTKNKKLLLKASQSGDITILKRIK